MKNLLNILLYTGFTFSFFAILYILYLVIFPLRYFTSDQPYKILNPNKEVRIGEDLIYSASYCKYTDYIPTRVVRSLVDSYVYDLPISTASNFQVGCHIAEVAVPIIVPASINTNHEYKLKIAIEYRFNALHTETKTFETESFVLLPAKE